MGSPKIRNVFLKSAERLEYIAECGMFAGCCSQITAADHYIEYPIIKASKKIFSTLYKQGDESFWWGMPGKKDFFETQLARLIALDFAALIADEGEFNPDEWKEETCDA